LVEISVEGYDSINAAVRAFSGLTNLVLVMVAPLDNVFGTKLPETASAGGMLSMFKGLAIGANAAEFLHLGLTPELRGRRRNGRGDANFEWHWRAHCGDVPS
jgi:hypothetical protein